MSARAYRRTQSAGGFHDDQGGRERAEMSDQRFQAGFIISNVKDLLGGADRRSRYLTVSKTKGGTICRAADHASPRAAKRGHRLRFIPENREMMKIQGRVELARRLRSCGHLVAKPTVSERPGRAADGPAAARAAVVGFASGIARIALIAARSTHPTPLYTSQSTLCSPPSTLHPPPSTPTLPVTMAIAA